MGNNQYKLRKFKCLGCGEQIEKRIAKDNTKYCSLGCFRRSKRPNRETGKIIKCNYCGNESYKQKCFLKYQHSFCSIQCANLYQARNKIEFICKTCGKHFRWSKSRGQATYCSIDCRNKDMDWIKNACIQGNLIQSKKRGLNRLEIAGQGILNEIKVAFNEQVLLFNKFLVDVLFKDYPIIIQWDGKYWHSKPQRQMLDVSQDAYLSKCGYAVKRFTDDQVYNEKELIVANIRRAIQEFTRKP